MILFDTIRFWIPTRRSELFCLSPKVLFHNDLLFCLSHDRSDLHETQAVIQMHCRIGFLNRQGNRLISSLLQLLKHAFHERRSDSVSPDTGDQCQSKRRGLVIVTIHAVRRAVHTKSRSAKKGYLTMVTFVLFPFIAGVIDSFIPNTPVMSPSILSALLLFFVNVQEMQIYSDTLTGLNNRRRSDQVLESYIEKADTSGFYLFMIDVNRFKLINDRYGHMESDRALQTIATSLKEVSSACSVFLSRWGGDEFLILSSREVAEPVEDFRAYLHQAVRNGAKEQKLPYDLSICVGYALCTSSLESPEDLTRAADRMLYEEKRIVHQTRTPASR